MVVDSKMFPVPPLVTSVKHLSSIIEERCLTLVTRGGTGNIFES